MKLRNETREIYGKGVNNRKIDIDNNSRMKLL